MGMPNKQPYEENLAVGCKMTLALTSALASSLLGIYPQDILAKVRKRYLQVCSLQTLCDSERLEVIQMSTGSWF